MNITITGTGSYIPETAVPNSDFLSHAFLDANGIAIAAPNTEIISKFEAITGIKERRYATKEQKASDLGFLAAEKAIADGQIDKETIDYIIYAHNFGDLAPGKPQGDILPSLATRVKHLLQIQNPNCVAFDLIFGCPGWLEAMIQAKALIASGMANTCLLIGGETLSRVVDVHDRDSMIFADGAGATILQKDGGNGSILAHATQTYANDEAYFLYFDSSYENSAKNEQQYIKMHGRKVYEFACIKVPKAMKACLDKSGVAIDEVKKIFIHQANEKMDEAIIKRFYKQYNKPVPEGIMPMNIQQLGNSSVATIPTLLDMVRKEELNSHKLKEGDVILFASVGAGMNINAMLYKV